MSLAPAVGDGVLNRSTPIAETSLRGLHPRSIEDPGEVRWLLERAYENACVFHRGLNAQIDLETAQLQRIDTDRLIFKANNFDKRHREQVFLNFDLEGRAYFFATIRIASPNVDRFVVRIPETIFYSERRDRMRRASGVRAGDPREVRLEFERSASVEGLVADLSPSGFGVLVQSESVRTSDSLVELNFLDGAKAGSKIRAQLRNWHPIKNRPGWTRVGLVQTKADVVEPIDIEYWTSTRDGAHEVRDGLTDEGYVADAEPQILRFSNSNGEEIVGLIDSWGDLHGTTAVVIPNGWGQTKEAMLPLARTIVATFRGAGVPVCVIRFDGIRKRGESHNDPSCRKPGREHLHYVFSQGADDIIEIAKFLRNSPDLEPSSIIVVSFSAAAIETRKALTLDSEGMINAWVSVVGSPDLQSMTRSISGGVDFALGYERDMRFGYQELLTVLVNIDRIAFDAKTNQMISIDDARDDFSQIRIPISWFHGRYDAWVELDRVRDVLSHGYGKNRRLIVLPIGHRLRNSRIAREFFAAIAAEVGRIVDINNLVPRTASAREIRTLRAKESARLSPRNPTLREFWRDYLIGRDRSFGSELLTHGSAYQEVMEVQISLLDLRPGNRVLDLGAGNGAFEVQLQSSAACPPNIRVSAIDFVREALYRARKNFEETKLTSSKAAVSFLEADLNLGKRKRFIPVKSGSYDGVIASFLISYIDNPDGILREIHRLLRSGGRLVLSSLRSDADISLLYEESVTEFQLGIAKTSLRDIARTNISAVAQNFLNDAAWILQLEESGIFRFWEPSELHAFISNAGFTAVEVVEALGNPPQALVASGIRS